MNSKLAITSVVLCALSLTACTDQKEMADIKQRLDSAEKRLSALETNKPAQSAPAAVSQAEPSWSPTPPAVPAATQSPVAVADSAKVDPDGPYSDISGVYCEEQINKMRRLGVLEQDSKFNPDAPIKRGEFVRWMVKAANKLADGKLRLARGGTATFTDVSSSHPDYPYIQALCNEGLSVGYDDKTFRPDKALTRDEMLALKAPFDKTIAGITLQNTDLITPKTVRAPYQDLDQVSQRMRVGVSEGWAGGDNLDNFERAFGSTKFMKPHETVTRAQAAACLSEMGSRFGNTHYGFKFI